MLRSVFAGLLILVVGQVIGQNTTYKFWVELTNKNDNGFTIDHPEAFLSPKAIARRQKQNIAITAQDLPITMSYQEGIEKLGVRVVHNSRWFNSVTVECKDTSVMKAIRKLEYVKGSRLLYARIEPETPQKSPDAMMEYLMSVNAPKKADNESEYGFGLGQISMLNGDDLHAKGYKGQGIVIVVLDAGFFHMNEMETFDKMREEGRLLGTYDMVKKDSMVYEDDMHGMNVLSCMASNTPGKMIGTAPSASYWLIRTEDNFSEFPIEESNWIAGAEFADSVGADVINSSLGYTLYDAKNLSYTYKSLDGTSLISRAATRCAGVGMIVCNAAGNEGDGDWHFVGVPADADSIITVGGVDAMFEHSTFSSFGPTADGRIKPTVCAQATATYVASSKGKFYQSQGTSFASPVLCGMVASLWSANPSATNMQVIEAVKQSADRYSHPDNTFGYGVPDFMMANRLLGGDKEFDYTQDQWMEMIPTEYFKTIPINFYSSKAQTLTLILRDHKGRKVRNMSFDLQAGQFFLYTLQDLPRSKKGLTLEITLDNEVSSIPLKKIEP